MTDEDPRENPGADTEGTGGGGANPAHDKTVEDLAKNRDAGVYSGTSRDGQHPEEDDVRSG